MLDIIGKKWFYFLLSGLIIIPGIISLMLFGLKLGIDFTGGSLIEVQSSKIKDQINKENIIKIANSDQIEVISIQNSDKNSLIIRSKPIDKNQNEKFQEDLKKDFDDIKELRFETVGPIIGKETSENAIKAVIIASLAIIIYISLSFSKIPKPYSSFKFGICAVIALIHDILVVVGIFSIFGHFFKVEIDSLFITALLTVMGFSVHDTIVVFDRIRENLKKMYGRPFSQVVNESIVQTLARSLSTSLTVLFTLLALLLFGGESIRWFVMALLIGVTSGTYSSIFNAAPLLVLWEENSTRK